MTGPVFFFSSLVTVLYILLSFSGSSKVGINTPHVSISICTISAIFCVFFSASGKKPNMICIFSSSRRE